MSWPFKRLDSTIRRVALRHCMKRRKSRYGWSYERDTCLSQEHCTETSKDGAGFVVDGMNADNMGGRAKREQNHGADGFKEVKLVAHLERKLGVEEGNG